MYSYFIYKCLTKPVGVEKMDTEQMIRELRYLENKYKEYTYSTFETNWYYLCHDVADRLEELNNELKALKSKL